MAQILEESDHVILTLYDLRCVTFFSAYLSNHFMAAVSLHLGMLQKDKESVKTLGIQCYSYLPDLVLTRT